MRVLFVCAAKAREFRKQQSRILEEVNQKLLLWLTGADGGDGANDVLLQALRDGKLDEQVMGMVTRGTLNRASHAHMFILFVCFSVDD